MASEKKFELQAFSFGAAKEQTRAPRPVRIGLIQNRIVRPTTDPILEQVSLQLAHLTTRGDWRPDAVEGRDSGETEGNDARCLPLWRQCPLLPGGLQ